MVSPMTQSVLSRTCESIIQLLCVLLQIVDALVLQQLLPEQDVHLGVEVLHVSGDLGHVLQLSHTLLQGQADHQC